MDSSKVLLRSAMIVTLIIAGAYARPSLYPVQELIYTYPSASQQTTVVRDLLGNQGTAYAYQNNDGFSSSSVAVSRSDNSKTLAYLPAVAPAVFAQQPLVYAHDHYQPGIAPAVAYSDYNTYI